MNNTEEILLDEMKSIFVSFKKLGLYPYELYTLMCGVATRYNYFYSLDTHSKLLNVL